MFYQGQPLRHFTFMYLEQHLPSIYSFLQKLKMPKKKNEQLTNGKSNSHSNNSKLLFAFV